MRNKLTFLSRVFCLCFSLITAYTSHAQVSILNSNLNSFNVTPQSLCDINMMNYNNSETQVTLQVKLLNADNQPLVIVNSTPFLLKKGINNSNTLNIKIQSVSFTGSAQAQHIQASHMLPSGRFYHCVTVKPSTSFEEGDDYCQEIESDLSSFLFLVSPADKDIIETPHPLLLWSHSEPFNIMTSGEFYRLIVVELNPSQSAEAGVTANTPVYIKNNLTTHQVQYPFDANELQKGKRYGWQVQRVANGVITNKSEAWEFALSPDRATSEAKYAVLKKTLDAGYYIAHNNKVFFKFDEDYASGTLSCVIYNSKRKAIQPKAHNQNQQTATVNLKNNGYNRYEINLNELTVSQGFHTLEVKNEKGENFLLKFFIE